jgi:hypothetical protein
MNAAIFVYGAYGHTAHDVLAPLARHDMHITSEHHLGGA